MLLPKDFAVSYINPRVGSLLKLFLGDWLVIVNYSSVVGLSFLAPDPRFTAELSFAINHLKAPDLSSTGQSLQGK